MVIKSMFLEHFGRFQGKKLELGPGLNIIYGGNEAGKTTLHAFVKAMLFGMERSRGRTGWKDAYSRYLPWDTPASYSGFMEVEVKGSCYSIYRNFYKDAKAAECVNRQTGEPVTAADGKPAFLPDECSPAMYSNTISMEQNKVHAEKELASLLEDYAANLSTTKDSRINLTKALKKLEGREKAILSEHIPDRQKALQDKLGEMKEKNRELKQSQARLSELREEYGRAEVRLASDFQSWEKKRAKLGRQIWPKLAAGAGAAALLAALAYPLVMMQGYRAGILSGGILWYLLPGALLLGGGIAGIVRNHGTGASEPENPWEEGRKSQEEKRVEMERLNWRIDCLDEELLEEEEVKKEIRELAERQEESRDDLKALELAKTLILDLSGQLKAGFGTELNQKMSQLFAHISGGRYQTISMDRDFKIRAGQEYRYIEEGQLSKGTLDQLHMSIRMAAGDIMLSGSAVPLILDDSLAYYDEERTEALLDWLAKERRQILLLTCHKREAAYLAGEGRAFQYIAL